MTPADVDAIEAKYRQAGKKPGSLEAFFYADVPKLIRALRESVSQKPKAGKARR